MVKKLGILPGKYAEIAAKKGTGKGWVILSRVLVLKETKRKKLRSIKKGYEDKEEGQEGRIYASGAFKRLKTNLKTVKANFLRLL